MTGSPFQTGFRHICRRSEVALENENVADRSKPCKQTSQRQFHEGKNRHSSKQKQMYFSDDSISYETTASQDERIEQGLQQEKKEENIRQNVKEAARKDDFEEAFRDKTNEIFQLPGMTFLKFTHTKIKFCFEPCKVVTLVRKDVKFYCSLRYYKKYDVWNIRRDSFPANYKRRIYNIFYRGEFFSVTDDNLADAIFRIYVQLKLWAKEEEEFRQEKFMRYQNGEDVELDSDDEELFLNEDERKELHDKREMVLRRMIVPTDLPELAPERRKKKRKQQSLPERTRKKQRQRVLSPERTPPQKRRRRRILDMSDSG